MDKQLNSPILFLIFNRLDTAERVFERIRQARPARLYFAADGPRGNRPDDKEKCASVRSLVEKVDWPCQTFTLFRESNLGCKLAVSSGISWFFEQEEEGIILEDDCLPHPDFFPFCQEMLSRYRNDPTVFSVTGTNLVGTTEPDAEYFFGMIGGIWGWASWRRAWNHYELDIRSKFTQANWEKIQSVLKNRKLAVVLEELLRKSVVDGDVNTWDYQWFFARLLTAGKSVIPNKNLVSNLGFASVDATHTTNSDHPLAELPTFSLAGPYRSPASSSCRKDFDDANLKFFHPSWSDRLKTRIRKLVGI
jgi:hypothetical protein